MKKKANTLIILFLLTTIWGYGYIDPGTGSYIIQIIIAAFVGASLGVKIFWRHIKGFFGKLFSKGSQTQESKPQQDKELP